MGAGWSGLAVATFLRERGATVRVYEASGRVGGRIGTRREAGYLVETGPHGVIPSSEATRTLMRIADMPFVEAPPRAPRFVVHAGKPGRLPTGPPGLLRTPLLGAGAKARLLLEPLRGAGPPHETVAAFARRRLGPGVERLADAFVTGVYAGDPERLVLAHAFPDLHRMDREGGLLRGMRRTKAPQPRPTLAAPRDGMESWMRALAARLDVRLHAPALRVTAGARPLVETPEGTHAHDALVLALDPAATAKLLGIEKEPPLAPVTIVAFGVPREAAPAEGYGILAPEQERRHVLGALYESALFPDRAPEGHALVRCLVGGRRRPERAHLPEAEAVKRAWDDLVALGVVRGEPTLARAYPTAGIPQPEADHDAWLAALPKGPVRVLGIGQRAVGLDALAREAEALAQELTRA